jgi:hypothetical protein
MTDKVQHRLSRVRDHKPLGVVARLLGTPICPDTARTAKVN